MTFMSVAKLRASEPGQRILCLHHFYVQLPKEGQEEEGQLRETPGSGSCFPILVISDLENTDPPTSCPDNGQSQSKPRSSPLV